jgi:hypothetical protein
MATAIAANLIAQYKNIASDITRISNHHDAVIDNIDKLLSQAKTKLKTLSEQLLSKIKQY